MINHMTLQGRLCADPELRYTQNQTPVCSFRVAWSEKYKETETKLFLSCTAWRGLGEMISKNFTKSLSGEKHYLFGKHLSEESKKKLSVAKGKRVMCVETRETFHSTKAASESLGLTSTAVWRAIAGKNQTAGGFHWVYCN